MTTRFRALLLTALLATTVGCAGGQTGDEGEDSSACDEKRQAVSLTETTPLGFSAQDVLAFVAGTHTVALQWQPATLVPYGPEHDAADLVVEIESLGRARFVARSLPSSKPITLEGGDCCPDSVQVDVRVTLRSAGGALDETVDAVVDATTRDFAYATALRKPPFDGSLWFDPAALGTAHVEDLQLDLRFTPTEQSGRLSARFEDQSGSGPDSSVSLSIQSLATWGADSAPPLCGE